MAVDVTATPENVITDPESTAGDVTEDPNGGELQNYLEFAFWADDGDNVLENTETVLWTGLASALFNGSWQAIADSSGNGFSDSPILGDDTVHIAKAWCFGNLEQSAQTPGNLDPLVNTGFTCDGSGDQNNAQTDGIVASVSFYAEQARNNSGFLCSSLTPLVGGPAAIVSADPTVVDGGFTPEIGPTIDQEVSEYLGRTVMYTGPALGAGPDTIQWRITIDGPAAFAPDEVDMDEVGFNDPDGDGISIGTFHYPFQVVDADTIRASGSCTTADDHSNACATDAFSLDENDVFSNADKINFGASAPDGTYTIKYELVNTDGGAVVGTHTVAVEVI